MTAFNLPNNTIDDPVKLLNYGASELPFLVPGLLFLTYLIIAMSGFYAEQRRRGEGNFAMWMAVAGMITTTGAFFLTLTPFVIVDLFTLSVLVTITIVSALFAFFTRN